MVNVKDTMPVIICGPTGMSAFQIKGNTLHSTLMISVQHGKFPVYKELKKDDVKFLRRILENARIIIIDEISMVSHLMLAFIHKRLDEIFGNSNKMTYPFGNMNILLFGDLLQLPPVNEKPVFARVTAFDAKKNRNWHLWTLIMEIF